MRLARATLRNWMRYRGEHVLELGPMVYGVVAELVTDAERSNWLGKTSLLEALGPFPLFGWHQFRTEDEWITKGEGAGGVELVYDDGLRVVRSRERGKATRLEVFEPGATSAAKDAAAQEVLLRRVVLTQEDFFATCFFQQRQMARFILARPGDRMAVVSEWLQLGPLERAAARTQRKLAHLVDDEAKAALAVEAVRARIADVFSRRGIEREDGAVARLEEMAGAAELEAKAARARAEELQKKQGELAAWRKDAEGARSFRELGRQVSALEGSIPAKPPTKEGVAKLRAAAQELQRKDGELAAWRKDAEGARTYADLGRQLAEAERAIADVTVPGKSELAKLREAADVANAAARTAADEVKRKRSLASGAFDGRCPVGDIACPAVDVLNAQRARNGELLRGAEKAEQAARGNASEATSTRDAAERRGRELDTMKARAAALREQRARFQAAADRIARDGQPVPVEGLDAAWQRVTEAEHELREHETKVARLAALREQRARFQAAADRIARDGEPPENDGELATAYWDEAQDAEQRARELRRDVATITDAIATRAEATSTREALKARLVTAREGALLLGRNGAQRRVAEGALAEIEAGANEVLAEAGIDLAAFVRWARETKGLATACDSCGAPFPSSAKVKGCEKCGTPRGPKLDERLDVELTDRSGAAEDMAGITIQLSASAWLRARRSSAWSAAFIDEPFGALDEANRRALATHFATMLRGRYGFEQAFVIAHNRGIMDALPGRIRVIADGDVSRVEVA